LRIRFTIVFSERIIIVPKEKGRKVPGTITRVFLSKREDPNSRRYLPLLLSELNAVPIHRLSVVDHSKIPHPPPT